MGLIHLVNEVGELRGAHTHTHTPECRLLYIYELHKKKIKKKSHHNYEGYFTVHIMCHTFNQFLHNLVNSSGLAMGELFPHWKTCCCAFLYRACHACEIKEEKNKRSAILEQIALWQPRRVGFASIPIKTSTLENRAAENAAVRLGNLVS